MEKKLKDINRTMIIYDEDADDTKIVYSTSEMRSFYTTQEWVTVRHPPVSLLKYYNYWGREKYLHSLRVHTSHT